jgi:hypothetical protein
MIPQANWSGSSSSKDVSDFSMDQDSNFINFSENPCSMSYESTPPTDMIYALRSDKISQAFAEIDFYEGDTLCDN